MAEADRTGRRGGLAERADVVARVAAREGAPAAVASLRPTPEKADPANGDRPGTAVTRADSGELVPFTPIRQQTAAHLTRSLSTAAHTLVVTEVDYSAVDRVRRSAGLTYLPFVALAVIDQLRAYPRLNASIEGDALRLHPHVNLGIAVDLDFEGLIVPVVRDADELRLEALATRIAEMAERARRHSLRPADVERGTFTITNPGGYGTLLTGPIINQPQVGIVSSDGVRMRPVAVAEPGGGWQIAVHPVGNLSLSFDHRANDGAYASAFLAGVRANLTDRDWEAELA